MLRRSFFIRTIVFLALVFSLINNHATAAEDLRILSWEGYVTPADIKNVNQLLRSNDYDYQAKVIAPLAEGAEQMFDLIRRKKCDITFLTLFFIKMERERTSRLLQAINTQSPRLTHYKDLSKDLTHLEMGMNHTGPLYIPWGGGVYGFYANMNKVKESELPTSVSDLWSPRWQKHYSLNQSQQWYNVGLALMSLGLKPFVIDQMVRNQQRQALIEISKPDGSLQIALNTLYLNSGNFWNASPQFNDHLWIVSSWGPEVQKENEKGGKWKFINFKEGQMLWLDTINFVKDLKGKKLEAAEIVANYFISKPVQQRIVNKLSMYAASKVVSNSPIIKSSPDFFNSDMLVPPFDQVSHNIMKNMVSKARAAAKLPTPAQ